MEDAFTPPESYKLCTYFGRCHSFRMPASRWWVVIGRSRFRAADVMIRSSLARMKLHVVWTLVTTRSKRHGVIPCAHSGLTFFVRSGTRITEVENRGEKVSLDHVLSSDPISWP